MLTFRTTSLLALTTAALLATSGCSMLKSKEEAPKTGTLTQRFTMIDAEGRQYGIVEMDPVSGGRIVDIQGRTVGTIVPPNQGYQGYGVSPAPAVGVAPLPPANPQ